MDAEQRQTGNNNTNVRLIFTKDKNIWLTDKLHPIEIQQI